MKLQNTKLGDIEFDDAKIVNITDGLVGFSDVRRFVLLDARAGSPFRWFLAVDRPELAFVVTDPDQFFKDYETEIPDDDLGAVEYREGDELARLTLVTVRGRRKVDTTLNLRAPVIVNLRTMTGRQILMKTDRWGIQVPLPVTPPSLDVSQDPPSGGGQDKG